MNGNRLTGTGRQVTGLIKQAVGRGTDEPGTQTEGSAAQTAIKTRRAVGGGKNLVRYFGSE